jgi:hypothetical protein
MRHVVWTAVAAVLVAGVLVPSSGHAGAGGVTCTAATPPPPVTATTTATAPATTPDDVSAGVALAPTGGLAAVRTIEARQAARRTAATSTSTTSTTAASTNTTATTLPAFRTSGMPVCSVAYGLEPLQNTYVRSGITDSTGVRMFRVAGSTRLYNHPVGQAQLSMEYLDRYRRSHNSSDLTLAIRNAQRLIDTHIESRGGWYFPYEFNFYLYGDPTNVFKAPWYSAMAEGQAIQAFVRLYRVTGNAAWRTAADGAFAAINSAPAQGEPSVTWVSSGGDLWFDEYPRWPAYNGERVLNGHLWVVFGLYDYYLLTGNPEARTLYDGGLTTIARYLTTVFRTPRWWSKYSARALLPSRSYHHVHIEQMLYAQHETGLSRWASWARLLRSDAPAQTHLARQASLQPTLTKAYRLDSQNRVIATRSVHLTRANGAPISRRERAYGHEIVDLVSAGWLQGWWVPEGYALSRPVGPIDVQGYSPQLRVTISAGTVSAYRYTSTGAPSGTKTVRFASASTTTTSASGIADGRLAFYITSGTFSGYWLPQTTKVAVG